MDNAVDSEFFLPWLHCFNFQTCRHVQQELRCLAPELHSIPHVGLVKLRFSLQLDGIIYSDLGPVEVKKDPSFDDLGSYDFQYPFETTVTISVSWG